MNVLGADSSLRLCLFVKRLNVVPLHMIISLNASVQYPSASLILSLCCYNFTLKKCHAKVSQISSEPDNIFAGRSWFTAGLQPLAKCLIFLRMKPLGYIVCCCPTINANEDIRAPRSNTYCLILTEYEVVHQALSSPLSIVPRTKSCSGHHYRM